MRTNLSQRLYAALSFMLAGQLPGVFGILHDLARYGRLGSATPSFLVFYYFVTPAILAGVSGFVFGGDILNPDKVKSAGHAAVRGLFVSLVAWLAFVPILSSVVAPAMTFFQRLSWILVIGSLFIGWLIAGVGLVTSLLLYRFRKSHIGLSGEALMNYPPLLDNRQPASTTRRPQRPLL